MILDNHFKKWNWLAATFLSTIAVLYVLAVQLTHINPFVSSWDQVDFSMAMGRYDLRAMQPHFPGYPYFILGGLLAGIFVEEPNQALVFFNILFYASSLLPVYLLASRIVPKHSAILTAALLYTASYPLIIVNQPMSEGAALAAFWWYFWSIAAAKESHDNKWILLPLFLFSVLLGIRLSYIPMGIGLVYLLYIKRASRKITILGLVKYVAIAGLFQMIWVGALVLSEGGITSFIDLAFGFAGGHFQDWGGTAASNDLSLFARIKKFLFSNMFWWAIFSRTHVLMVIYIVIGILLFMPGNRNRLLFRNPAFRLAALMLLAYGAWALFAQNIDKPRHVLPMALLFLFIGLTMLLQKENNSLHIWLALLLLGFQAMTTAEFIKLQASEQPAVHQLARFLEHKDDFVLYTWEETRVLGYMEEPFPHKRVFTYNVFQHDRGLYKGRTIYLTDSVVKGFRTQGIDIDKKIEKVKGFHSEIIFDPIYHDITLYKWKP